MSFLDLKTAAPQIAERIQAYYEFLEILKEPKILRQLLAVLNCFDNEDRGRLSCRKSVLRLRKMIIARQLKRL